MSKSKQEKKEERQLKKIKFLGLNNTRFKQTWRKILEEDPGSMSGLGQSNVGKNHRKRPFKSPWPRKNHPYFKKKKKRR